jgi:redox-sensitive bicupin YhaK (pirin superfamily)
MTAGRGVIHSELPEQEEGLMEGFQLWLNLPSTRKMQAPWYRDFKAPELPRYRSAQGAEVTVIAGQSQGTAGAVQREGTEPLYLDIHLPAGAQFEHLLPESHNAFIYVYRGQVHLDGQAVPIQKMAILANEPGCDGVRLHAGPDSRLLLLAGRPLREPIVQYGPFVMNTKQEIYQAVTDYQSGQLTR